MILFLTSLFKTYISPALLVGLGSYNIKVFPVEFYSMLSGDIKTISGIIEIRGELTYSDGDITKEIHLNRAAVKTETDNIQIYIGRDTYNWAFESIFTPYRYLNPEITFTHLTFYKSGMDGGGMRFMGKDATVEVAGFLREGSSSEEFMERITYAGRLYVYYNNVEFQMPVIKGKTLNAGLGIRTSIGSLTVSSDANLEFTETCINKTLSAGSIKNIGENLILQMEYMYNSNADTLLTNPMSFGQWKHNLFISMGISKDLVFLDFYSFFIPEPEITYAGVNMGFSKERIQTGLIVYRYLSGNFDGWFVGLMAKI